MPIEIVINISPIEERLVKKARIKPNINKIVAVELKIFLFIMNLL
jgi:hypothetical protein